MTRTAEIVAEYKRRLEALYVYTYLEGEGAGPLEPSGEKEQNLKRYLKKNGIPTAFIEFRGH